MVRSSDPNPVSGEEGQWRAWVKGMGGLKNQGLWVNKGEIVYRNKGEVGKVKWDVSET